MTVKAHNDFFLAMFKLHNNNALTSSIQPVIFTTKQQSYRFAAWLVEMAEVLPEEPEKSTFEEVREAVRKT